MKAQQEELETRTKSFEQKQTQNQNMNPKTQTENSYIQNKDIFVAIEKGISTQKFAATPEAQQKLYKEVQAQDNFLRQINMITVGSQKGQSIYGSVTGSVMRRESSRSPVNLTDSNAISYETVKRYFDFLITHDMRDAWIGTGQDFNQIYKRLYREQYSIDLINNAFNGTARDATTTDVFKN